MRVGGVGGIVLLVLLERLLRAADGGHTVELTGATVKMSTPGLRNCDSKRSDFCENGDCIVDSRARYKSSMTFRSTFQCNAWEDS